MRIATTFKLPGSWSVLLAAPLLALGLSALPAAAMADPPGDTPHGSESMHGPDAARMHELMQQKVQRHLDHLAARLEIRASQQGAWNDFANTVRSMLPERPPQRPAQDVDAATRARRLADRAGEHARKLAQLADATAKLEQALDAPQRQVLDEVARNFGEHLRMHRMGGMHGMHGEHCGPKEHGPWHHGDGDEMPGDMHHGHHGDMHGHDQGAADSYDDEADADD